MAEDRPPLACPETTSKQTAKRVNLHERAAPMGAPLPFNFPFFEISGNMPTDSEVRMVVRGLKKKAGWRGHRDEGQAPQLVA